MRVYTPEQVEKHAGSKYLGVLVASKYARELNALPIEAVGSALEKKLTTRALDALVPGELEFRLIKRRRAGGLR